jgi:hypothetical protein
MKRKLIGICSVFLLTFIIVLPCTATNITHELNNIDSAEREEIYPTIPLVCGPPVPPLMWTNDFETFYISNPNPKGGAIFYIIDWGDGTSTEWLGPYEPTETITISHVWSEVGNYTIKAMSKNQFGNSKKCVYSLSLSSDLKFFHPSIGYVDVNYIFTIYWGDCEDCVCYMFIDWGDGTFEDWFGPYVGPVFSFAHSWSNPGEYTLGFRLKDPYGAETPWITFKITIRSPKKNFSNTLFLWFLEQFPILQKILLLLQR